MSSIFFRVGLLLSILFVSAPVPTESAVSSVDLGSESLKVAVVNLKPGQMPISVAINEMSKRKTPVLVAFHGGDRLMGEEAAGLIARYPDKVYSLARDMIGKPYGYVKKFLESMYLPFDVVENSRGGAGIRIDDGVTVYSPEELVAMLLKYAMDLAEFHSKVPVKDAVITVPPYFGQAERKGLLQAAQLAGVNVLSLINEHSGAALQYGIDKDFSNGSRYVVFYDMGSSSTYAALVYFSAYNAKEYGKTISINQFQVKNVRWDPQFGGWDMESRLVEYFVDEFNKQLGSGFDVRKSPKAMSKLKKQVKRTKEILSANKVAPISVESLYDDRDFRSTITRDKFEELCEDLWEKSLIPLKEVLEHSGLKVDDVYAVELIGGATRVPKLQANLQEFLGRKDLDRHLDSDEALVLGAALHAANLSDGIKLNRKLGMIDGSSYGVVIELDGPDLSKDESTRQLVQRMKKLLPSKISKYVTHDKDFEVSLAYDSEDILPPGVPSPIFAQYSVSGLTNASEKYASRNLSTPIKVNLQYSFSRSGIFKLDRADAVIEISEWIEVPKKNLTVDNSSSVSPNISVEVGPQNTTEGSTDSLETNGGLSSTSNSSLNDQSTADLAKETKLKKKTFRVPLKIVEKVLGPGKLSKEALLEAKGKLEALDKKDTERKRTAELKNSLEGCIYDTKETRFSELTARPASCEDARRYLAELQQVLKDAENLKNWLDAKEAEQKKTSSFSTPAFTSEEVEERVLDLKDTVASVNRIPKPKPKFEKPVKNESESGGNNTNASGSSSEEMSTSQDSKTKGTGDSSTHDKADSETEDHNEL
ncbi:heat shock protein 70 (Hsp 70) family protein [Actinidia rufa]|uniref:Heat shock protein 70 (Hsp 70) family protein n=1 Tax=Actinidia rufa TaxID=165716 RepID=A0A7J0DD16_9ERIC|nr:heat shock protein 70 (Hsp 70) family protein [Actinidia rufa]